MNRVEILTFVILISILASFIIYFSVIDSPTSSELSEKPSTSSQSKQSSPQMCDQWQQELIKVQVMKGLMGSEMLETTEFQSLMQQEFDLGQKLQFRCP